jgi:dihydroorotate dehydrogenase electron transfer subunit
MPCQQQVRVLANTPNGAYHRLELSAPAAAAARPGQFVALAVGEPPTAMLLRRAFSVARVDGEQVQLLIAGHGPGSSWLTARRPGDLLDLVGPLGRPFPDPSPGAGCVLVAGGYGAAPMVWWARELQARGHPVAVVLGAGDARRLAEVEAARVLGVPVQVTTDDGSAGHRGRVTDVLGEALESVAGQEVYACGPMAMLRAVAERGGDGVRVWCAVEESMACGIGVCMTCVLPVRGGDGVTRMVRSCVEGPTFSGDAVRWDAITTTPERAGAAVPADCWGAT